MSTSTASTGSTGHDSPPARRSTPANWLGQSLSPDDYVVRLDRRCIDELCRAVIRPAAGPDDSEHVRYYWPALSAVMTKVQETLRRGVGLVLLDRLPADRFDDEQNRRACRLLSEMIGPVVAQKFTGTWLYDVKDTGKKTGYGVRRSITNLEQGFHTDGGWLALTPDYVGLYCLRPAARGGLSRCLSLVALHDAVAQRSPRLLQRLYRPFYWDRQAEHPDRDVKFSCYPVFSRDADGALSARYYADYIYSGYRLAGVELDAAGRDALALLGELSADRRYWLEFRLEAGQVQLLNNRRLAHSRTAFQDETRPGRHFIRVWNRYQQPGHYDLDPSPRPLVAI